MPSTIFENFKIFPDFQYSLDLKSWILAFIGRAKAMYMIYICFFFYIKYKFYISVFAPTSVCLLSLGDRGSQVKCRTFAIRYIDKCYLVAPLC